MSKKKYSALLFLFSCMYFYYISYSLGTSSYKSMVTPTHNYKQFYNNISGDILPILTKDNVQGETIKTVRYTTSTVELNDSLEKDVELTINRYESGYLINNSHLCKDKGKENVVAIFITSAPGNFNQRDAIRLTWGHYTKMKGVTITFVLGRTQDISVADKVEEEHNVYGDLIVSNFVDSYENLTLKSLSIFAWVAEFCQETNFVLKTDDDVFVNVPNLLQFIATIHEMSNEDGRPAIYGCLAKSWAPIRDKKSKYYVSTKQYRGKFLPNFVTGPAYLLKPYTAKTLFYAALQKPYLKLEDVFITGITASEVNISRIHERKFGSEKYRAHQTAFCTLSKLISIHDLATHHHFDLWKKLHDKRSKCITSD